MSFSKPSKVYSRHANTTTLARVKAWKQEVQSIIRGQAVFRIVGDLQDLLGFDRAQSWMNTPRAELDQKTPLEAIIAGKESKVEDIVKHLSDDMLPF